MDNKWTKERSRPRSNHESGRHSLITCQDRIQSSSTVNSIFAPQDEFEAIEILLDDTKTTHSNTTPPKFFNRLFRGIPRKSRGLDSVQEDASLDFSSHKHDSQIPVPSLQETTSETHFGMTSGTSTAHYLPGRFDDYDTFSCMSSLSGSEATSIFMSRPQLSHPAALDRQESLGIKSIQEVRASLHVMEQQLQNASHNGDRVSRVKVMQALLTVAESLEDPEERDRIRKEIAAMVAAGKCLDSNGQRCSRLDAPLGDKENVEVPSGKTRTRFSNDESTRSPFMVFSGIFGATSKEKSGADKELEDLLWTEFVTERNRTNEKPQTRSAQKQPTVHRIFAKSRQPRPRSFEEKPFDSKSKSTDANVQASTAVESRPVSMLWWNLMGSTNHKENEPSSSSSSSEVSGYENDIGEEYESSSSDDEEFKQPPINITVTKQSFLKPPSQMAAPRRQRNAVKKARESQLRTRIKTRMVDTESRLGFEMGTIVSSD